MDRHGSHDWLVPLLEPASPQIQVQFLDLANFFEALYNFYTFRNPPATFASLTLIGAYFLLSLFSSSEFILKLFWFTVGLNFFALWPISSLYPHYRLLVSPMKWALWDVPTQAEWCFRYLQERSAVVKETLLSFPPPNFDSDSYDSDTSTSSFQTALTTQPNEKDFLTIKCTHHHTPGHLTLTTSSLRFTSSTPLSHPSFEHPFKDLVEISKIQADSLEVEFQTKLQDGGSATADIVFLENIRGRDKAFNALIGFSGLRWQHLQKVVDVESS